MTTKEDLRRWFNEGVELKATHMIVVCDTFDHEDYPVYVKQVALSEQETPESKYTRPCKVHDVRNYVATHYNGQNMQRTMEVYRMADSLEEQLNAGSLVFRY
jgi:hypothetical protein